MSSTGGNSASTARNFWIYFWIYTGLVLGALASVSANIAYTYIPPRSQPAWWPRTRLWDPAAYIPPPGDVAVAVFCPVAIFILTEVITRPRWREGRLSFAVRAISAVMVGLPVAVASYLHLCSLLEYYSTVPFIAYTLPLTVDGLMLACTAALQLTGTDAPMLVEQSEDQASATDDVVVLPHPRMPLDTQPEPSDVMEARWAAPSTAETANNSQAPPAAPATSTGNEPPGPVAQHLPPVGHGEPTVKHGPPPHSPTVATMVGRPEPVAPPVGQLGPPVGTERPPLASPWPPPPTRESVEGPPVGNDEQGPEYDALPAAPPVGPTGPPVGAPSLLLALAGPPVGYNESTKQYRPPPLPSPVGQLGPPVGTDPFPPELLRPPPPLREPESGPPVGELATGEVDPSDPGPTGGPAAPIGDEDGRPVPFGRLGNADLSDVEIIALALADKPNSRITGTGLRKDFGVGPNRAARIRDEISKRRHAARLATRIHDLIGQMHTAENEAAPRPYEPSADS